MTRTEAVAYINRWLGAYLAAANRAATDTETGIKPAIDAALIAMDTSRDDLATAAPTDAEGYEAQLEYRALKLIVRDLGASSFDVGVSGDSYKLEQVYKHAASDLAMAESWVLELFGTTGAGFGEIGGVIALDLDFLMDAPLPYARVS